MQMEFVHVELNLLWTKPLWDAENHATLHSDTCSTHCIYVYLNDGFCDLKSAQSHIAILFLFNALDQTASNLNANLTWCIHGQWQNSVYWPLNHSLCWVIWGYKKLLYDLNICIKHRDIQAKDTQSQVVIYTTYIQHEVFLNVLVKDSYSTELIFAPTKAFTPGYADDKYKSESFLLLWWQAIIPFPLWRTLLLNRMCSKNSSI